jgi:hypothetical protein
MVMNAKWHHVRSWPSQFKEARKGNKTAEFRLADRNYQAGDALVLHEWDPERQDYTGECFLFMITHVQRGGEFGIPEGYAVLSIRRPSA